MSDLPERQWMMREPAPTEYMRIVRDEEPTDEAVSVDDDVDMDAMAFLAGAAEGAADDDAADVFTAAVVHFQPDTSECEFLKAGALGGQRVRPYRKLCEVVSSRRIGNGLSSFIGPFVDQLYGGA